MNTEDLLRLITAVSESKLTRFEYDNEGEHIAFSKKERPSVLTSAAPADTPAPAADGIPEGKVVVSPLVGVFYAAPAEGADPFVSVGNSVKKGQTLAIVEAMKLMNEIECEYDGTVKEILVRDGESVEYGQPLFVIA